MTSTNTSAEKMIIDGVTFNAQTDYIYTKPKANPSGGKNIGIINEKTRTALYLNTPLMLTWGVNANTFTDDTETTTYDMSLQFPNEEYNSPNVKKFLDNMKAFESKLKADAIANSKEWMNKAKLSTDVVDALFTPMLKYPKDKESGEFDYDRPPTLRVKMPLWDGVWKCELYDMEQNLIFPNEKELYPPDLIAKATNVATVIQCGGLWFANGKFGVTWRFIQAVVKPRQSLMGKCLINLSSSEKEMMKKNAPGDDNDNEDDSNIVQVVDSSDDDDDDDTPVTPAQEVAQEVAAAVPEVPKKKVVRKKKSSDAE